MTKIKDLLLKYPIKTTFSILLTLTVTTATIIILIVDVNSSFSSLKREKLKEIQIISDNVYQQADYLINTNDISTLEKIIATFSAYQHVQLINVVDKRGQIILSSKKALKNTTDFSDNKEGCNFNQPFDIICSYNLENGYRLKMHYNIYNSFKDMLFSMFIKYLVIFMIFVSMTMVINRSFFKLISEKIEEIVNFLKLSQEGNTIKPLIIKGNNELSYIATQITLAHQKLWQMINVDNLTGIPNRFFLEKQF